MLCPKIILVLFSTTPVAGIVLSRRLLADILCLCLENPCRNTGKSVLSGLSNIETLLHAFLADQNAVLPGEL